MLLYYYRPFAQPSCEQYKYNIVGESDSDAGLGTYRVGPAAERGATYGGGASDDGDAEEHRNGLVNVGHQRSADSRQATLDHRRAYAPAGPRRGRH